MARRARFSFSMASMGIRPSLTGKTKNMWCMHCVTWVPRGRVSPREGEGHRALDPPAVVSIFPY
jgi:hypothetical protein